MAEYPSLSTFETQVPGLTEAELVKEGGQKAVYRATIEGQTVALKVIALDPRESEPEESDPEEFDSGESDSEESEPDNSSAVERAKREVAILEQVDIPVLARLGPSGLSKIHTDEGRWLYFTEEWIEGINLRKMIHNSRLEPKKVSRLGVDLIQAACWLSDRGLIHRDIKPDNIIWATDRSRFVLLDPGIAFDLYGPSLTSFLGPIGTMGYFSPEQINASPKRTLDFRSDLFTIGVVLYEAAVQEHPFMTANTTPYQTMAGILAVAPKPVVERRRDFPASLSSFIARLLGKAPHLRYRTCKQARQAIEELATTLGVTE